MKRNFYAIVLSSFLVAVADAEERPLWEIGLGPALLYFSDYRGADEGRSYLYPFPYVIYRGDFLRADREGVRGVFFENSRVELDLSVSGTIPLDSEKNTARAGMPDLNPTVDFGPSITVTLARNPTQDWILDLRLPVRAAVASDFSHAQSIGWITYPHINLELHPIFLGGEWDLGLQTGVMFASSKYHQYFYGVDSQFVTTERPAYSATGGYSGAVALASLTRRFGRFWIGGFMRYDYLDSVVFDDSPLMRRNQSFGAGIAVAWVFAQSDRMVEMND